MADRKEDATTNENSGTANREIWTTRRTIILAIIVVIIVGVTAGIAIYRDRIAPFNSVIVSVNDREFNMRYFLKRINYSGEQSFEMLSTLTKEEVLRQVAPNPPYNITVTDEDINLFARDVARGPDDTIDEGVFKEWYRQQLNESGFSDEEYRELLMTLILNEEMFNYLGERLPRVAEQVFVNLIAVADFQTATKVKEKLDEGENFADLAREYSIDPGLRENGGKSGWFPQGVLDTALDSAAFELEIGEHSEAFYISDELAAVIMISERAEAMEIDEDALEVLKVKALEDWYNAESKNHEVDFHGFSGGGYDSETDAWVSWQLMRMQRGRRDEEPSGQPGQPGPTG
jgi:foldase protein PrsA